MLFNKGNRWKGERRVEGVRGVQYTVQGPRVDRDSRHDTKEGFPSK
jgi:hypothetical protein